MPDYTDKLGGLLPASPNTYPKTVTKPPRIDIEPLEYEALIESHGARVRVTPTVLCPNRTSLEDTNHVLDCQLCWGSGNVDLDSNAIEDWAYIQGIKLDKKFEFHGIFDLKDAQITTRAGVKLYYWYKIEVIDFSSLFNQLMKRGTGDVDRLRYLPTKNSDFCFHCIDSAGFRFIRDEHYRIDGQEIKWRGVKRPAAGTLYSLIYPILPTFRVLELLHENRFYYFGHNIPVKVPVQLPQNALIRWDYIARGAGNAIEVKT